MKRMWPWMLAGGAALVLFGSGKKSSAQAPSLRPSPDTPGSSPPSGEGRPEWLLDLIDAGYVEPKKPSDYSTGYSVNPKSDEEESAFAQELISASDGSVVFAEMYAGKQHSVFVEVRGGGVPTETNLGGFVSVERFPYAGSPGASIPEVWVVEIGQGNALAVVERIIEQAMQHADTNPLHSVFDPDLG
jgi:hypothetical protein